MEELNKEIENFKKLIDKKYIRYLKKDFDVTDDLDEIKDSFDYVIETMHKTLQEKDLEIKKLQNYIVELYNTSKLLTDDIAAIKHRSNKIFIENFDLQNQFELIFKDNKEINKLTLENDEVK